MKVDNRRTAIPGCVVEMTSIGYQTRRPFRIRAIDKRTVSTNVYACLSAPRLSATQIDSPGVHCYARTHVLFGLVRFVSMVGMQYALRLSSV